MRGLKRRAEVSNNLASSVASFTDAWIETEKFDAAMKQAWVASFTDAWIETESFGQVQKVAFVASFTDAWIETKFPAPLIHLGGSHLLQMRGLKLKKQRHFQHVGSRIFYRCVD